MNHLLSLIVFIPLIGAAICLVLPEKEEKSIKTTAVATALIPFLLSILLFLAFDRTTASMQFVERFAWIPQLNIQYFIGIDGLSVALVILNAMLCFICMIASWNVEKGVKGYFAFFLLLETAMAGVFVSLDFFLFFVFWEVMLLPMYFLIGIWGSKSRKDPDGRVRGGPYAAIKFFLYTLFGSALMLIAMILIYFRGGHTFDLLVLSKHTFSPMFQSVMWMLLFIGFAIKIPAFPFHTWLPDAHVEAPTAISVILAGVLLKMGTYGILRINFSIFPQATVDWAWSCLIILGLINMIYGALCAMSQKDLKKLVAYSSVSHMGYVMIGMGAFTIFGINGAVLQMFNHGIVTAMLFLLVGVIYDRAHHRNIDGFGGLASIMPNYAGVTMLAFFAALGLPGLCGFISEILVFLGVFQRYPIAAALGTPAILLGAGYMLWAFQRMFMNKPNEAYLGLPDLSFREKFILAPLGFLILLVGLYPQVILSLQDVTLRHLIKPLMLIAGPATGIFHW